MKNNVKKTRKVLDKAQELLDKYADDNSIYYLELKKSLEEYQKLVNIDKTTNNLYIKHLKSLCEILIQRKKFMNIVINTICVLFLVMIFLFICTSRSLELSKIFNSKRYVKINVNYKDITSFNAFTLNDSQNYKDLMPLNITLSSKTPDDNLVIYYDVYIIEQNEDIKENELMDRDIFVYNVISNYEDSGIKFLKDSKINKEKILIYSGKFKANEEENIEIRMWLDDNSINYENKIYKYKLYVEGYKV